MPRPAAFFYLLGEISGLAHADLFEEVEDRACGLLQGFRLQYCPACRSHCGGGDKTVGCAAGACDAQALGPVRERVPLVVELRLDEAMLLSTELPPVGVARDGSSSVYRKFLVELGRHPLDVRLRDTARTERYDHTLDVPVDITPGPHVVIDLKPEKGRFQLL